MKAMLEKFDHTKYNGTEQTCVVHYGTPYNFVELDRDFMDKLKAHMQRKIMLCQVDLEDLDPATLLVMYIFENAH